MSEVDYRQIITELPELARRLAVTLVPSQVQRFSTTPAAPGIRDPTVKQDRIIEAFKTVLELATALTAEWQMFMAEYFDVEPVHGIRVTTEVRDGLIADDPDTAAHLVQPHVDWLLEHWVDMEIHPLFYRATDMIDASKVGQLVRGLSDEPRSEVRIPCEKTGCDGYMRIDTHRSYARCEQCDHVITGRAWMPKAEAAEHIGKSKRTIDRWIAAGEIETRTRGFTVLVEVRECAQLAEYKRVQKLLNLAENPTPIVSPDVIASTQ